MPLSAGLRGSALGPGSASWAVCPSRPPAPASMCSRIVICVRPRRGIFLLLNEDLTREQVWITAGLGEEEGGFNPLPPAPCPCVTRLGPPGAAGPGAAAAAAAADGGRWRGRPGSSLRRRPPSRGDRSSSSLGSQGTSFWGKHITNQSRSLRLISVAWRLLFFFACCHFRPPPPPDKHLGESQTARCPVMSRRIW